MTISHEFFGELDFSHNTEMDYVVWEEDISFNNGFVEVALWAKDEHHLTQEKLNKYADFIHNLKKFDEISREKLTEYLTNDNLYITLHAEEFPNSPIIESLGKNPTIADFVKKINLSSLALWQANDMVEEEIVFDYMIDKENSNQILAVKFDINGNFLEVAWES